MKRVIDLPDELAQNLDFYLQEHPEETFFSLVKVVGVPEIATIMNCTRQNILKLKNSHIDTFPFPINSDGKSLNWHLAEVLKWYQSTGKSIDTALLEVAEFAMQFNLKKQNQNLNCDRNLKEKARALVC